MINICYITCSSDGLATGDGLDSQGITVLFLVGIRDLSLLHCPVSTVDSFTKGKQPGHATDQSLPCARDLYLLLLPVCFHGVMLN